MIILMMLKKGQRFWWLGEVGYIAGVLWPRTRGPELVKSFDLLDFCLNCSSRGSMHTVP